MKKHWFMVIGVSGNEQASSYFSKDDKNVSKVEIDTRFKDHLANMLSTKADKVLILNIVYLGEMTKEEFLENP